MVTGPDFLLQRLHGGLVHYAVLLPAQHFHLAQDDLENSIVLSAQAEMWQMRLQCAFIVASCTALFCCPNHLTQDDLFHSSAFS